MNFCSFSACSVQQTGEAIGDDVQLLIAVPNTLASEAVSLIMKGQIIMAGGYG